MRHVPGQWYNVYTHINSSKVIADSEIFSDPAFKFKHKLRKLSDREKRVYAISTRDFRANLSYCISRLSVIDELLIEHNHKSIAVLINYEKYRNLLKVVEIINKTQMEAWNEMREIIDTQGNAKEPDWG